VAGDPLAGRVALVTGASGGIGQAIARRLAGAGANLALAYAREPTPGLRNAYLTNQVLGIDGGTYPR
jgi:NAD(P)-dependent dehydrogenase (short-subunit alcohol dehydrogenase family)